MAAQKPKKKKKKILLTEIFGFLKHFLTQTQLTKIHNSLDSSRPYASLLENPRIWGSKELFLRENDFKTCSSVNSTKCKNC